MAKSGKPTTNPDQANCSRCGAPLAWELFEITDVKGRRRDSNDHVRAVCTNVVDGEPCRARYTQYINR